MKTIAISFSKSAEKDLNKVPANIKQKLLTWVRALKLVGLYEVQKLPGYHDEPLKGDRVGQRSIRLNRAYRAIYVKDERRETITVEVIEVNKHEY